MDTQELQRLKNKYDIVGNDPSMNRVLEMAMAVAPTDLTVLISGESGVGKDVVPKIIHQNSLRRTGKYFAVNCGAIPEGTIDSELFGHEKGSFTGAIEARKGYFEEADGGTLFLDEIGEMPMSSQAKLLRVLQSGEYIRVGSSKVGKTNVRVIAATNKNLAYAVSKGKFRADLYYRLNAIQITIPALRERKEDIYLMFRKFVSDFSEKYKLSKVTLTHDAVHMLTSYRWPGNVRQLKNIAETVEALEAERMIQGAERCEVNAARLAYYMPKEESITPPALVGGQEGKISDDDKQEIYKALYALSSEVAELKKRVAELSGVMPHQALPPATQFPHSGFKPGDTAPDTAWDIQEQEDEFEVPVSPDKEEKPEAQSLSIKNMSEDLIRKALEKHGGNRKKAAEELGVSERTLYRKLPPEYKTTKK